MFFAAFIVAMLWLFGLYVKRASVAPGRSTTIIITVREPHVNVIQLLPGIEHVEHPSGQEKQHFHHTSFVPRNEPISPKQHFHHTSFVPRNEPISPTR